MINLNTLQNDLQIIVELDKVDIAGETEFYKIYSGKYSIKNQRMFKFFKWSTKICSIILFGYIIYKLLF